MDVEYYISPLGSISSVHLMCSFFVTLPFFYFSGQDNKAEPPCTLGHADRDRSPLKDLLHHFLMVRSLWVTRDQTVSSDTVRPSDRQRYLRLNPTHRLSRAMWLQNTCHASVILHNLIERKSCDKVESGYTQSEWKETHAHVRHVVFVWPGYDFLGESFIWLQPAGGRVGEVEVGFMFSNSIVHYTVKGPELPVVCSNKPELGLHARCKRTAKGQAKKKKKLKLQDLKKMPKSSTSELSPQTVPGWCLAWWKNSFYEETADLPGPSRPPCLFKVSEIGVFSPGGLQQILWSDPKIEISLAKKNKHRNYNTGAGLFIQNNEFVSIHANHLTQKGSLLMWVFFFSLEAKHCSRSMCLVHENVWGMWKAYTQPMLTQSD